MPETLEGKDTTWLSRFVEGIIRESVPSQLINVNAEELSVSEMLTVLDQVTLSRIALDYINKNLTTTTPADTNNLVWNGTAWVVEAGGMHKLFDSTLTGTAASFDVQNIPATYAALKGVMYVRSNKAATSVHDLFIRLNNDSGSNYDSQSVSGQNATAGAAESIGAAQAKCGALQGASAVANEFMSGHFLIPNYAGTTGRKSGVSNIEAKWADATNSMASQQWGFTWRSTAAVNRVTIFPEGGNSFIAGSRFTLYGIG